MLPETSVGRYSSVVTLQLLAHNQVYPLAQIGPNCVILKSPALLPPGLATIVMVVDGDERRWDVTLMESAQPVDVIRTCSA